MRTHVLVFHPALEQSRVNNAWAQAARGAGYLVRDLYQQYPDFRIDVAEEQRLAEEADRLVFQFPLHWYAPPALMKLWTEEVLRYEWAYGGPDRLAGKAWQCAVTVGAAETEYRVEGSRGHTLEEFLRPIERTAMFCSMRWLPPFAAYGTGYLGEEGVEESVRAYLDALASPALG